MEKKLYNLTSPQYSIWLTEQFSKNTSLNNVGGYVFIHDKINFDCLKKAIEFYIKKNTALNLKITLKNGEPKQYVSDSEEPKIDLIELNQEEVESFNQKILNTPFNFLDSLLYKFVIFRLPDGRGGFNVTLHHIISDAWNISLLIDQIINCYYSLLNNEVIDLTPFPSYIEYINSEEEYLNSNRYTKDNEFWNTLFDSTPEISYISNQTNKNVNTLANRKVYTLEPEYYSQLNNFCKEYNCSIYTFFMSIYSLYIAKINNIQTPIIGTPVLNRNNYKEKHTAGMFVSTVPFKVNLDYNSSFVDFLKVVSKAQMSIFRHQKYPYNMLLEDLNKKYNSTHNLYDMSISYQNARTNHNQANVNYTSNWLFNGHCMDTLQIHFYDMDDTGTINMLYDYQISKLDENAVDRIHCRIIEICNNVLNNPNILIKNIEIIDANEKNQILNTFNKTQLNHPRNIGVHELIELIAKQNPNNNAIIDNNSSITYKELLEKSDLIARNLLYNGVKKADCIAVLFNKKDINLICSLLGVLKAGACFLAIYSDYPNDRIQYMIQDSNAKLLITNNSFSSFDFDIPILNINNLQDTNKEDIIFPKAMNDDNAYLIYTSGSTGNPKGTVQSHNNLINFVYSFQHFLENTISTNDAMLSVTNICFDVSIAEIFTALIFGATLYLYKDLNYSNPHELAKYIMENRITFSYFPPSMLQSVYEELKEYDNIFLNKMLVGVEPIKASILLDYLKLNPNMKIINGYGPSETTICCTMYPFNKNISPDTITPIGVPVGNSKIFIYDSNKRLVPIGDVGEIYVQGECVGNGYINNPQATQERFDLTNKIYRTGDLAKWLPDGNILFVGRNDNQVKYRGYRIDLGEIEHCIKNIELVENCTVLLNNQIKKNTILTAFIVLKENRLKEEDIRAILSSSLPHYMIPNQFVFLDSFPITPNGKIDRKRLLNMVSYKAETPYVAPSTDLEKKLAKLWANVLDKEKVGINDNFFELGGDSLSAIKIVTLATQEGIVLSAQNFYTYPTISLLLKHYMTQGLEVKYNYIKQLDIEQHNITSIENDIFLVGSTGFLGSHILYELINHTDAKVYCLIRGESEAHSKNRLQERLHQYFGDALDSYFDDRIIVINGDFSKKHFGLENSEYQFLLKNIKTIINSAAVVKHIGDYNYFYKMNILSVENLIHFCKECNNAHLAHISTLSVSGNQSSIKGNHFFTEKDLYIKQNIDESIYIQTKFEAEQLLAKEIENGLNATIFRLGNITWRNSDGVFQVNENENLFFNILNFITLTKKIPLSLADKVFNISPVDECARLIVDILLKANHYKIYHIVNFNKLTLKNIVDFLNKLDYNIEFIEDKDYKNILGNHLEQFPYIAQQFSQMNNFNNIIVDSPYTLKTLKELNFNWTIIDVNYMNKKFGGI